LDKDQQLRAYLDASELVKRRLGLIGFASWLKSSHVLFGCFGIALVLVLRQVLGWNSLEVLLLLILFGVWGGIGFLLILKRAPRVLEALVKLDHSGAWKDRFASAWAFLNQENRGVGEELHIEIAGDSLDEALAAFPEANPLPDLRVAWVLPALAVVFSLTPILRPTPDAADNLLSAEMVNEAGGQAEEINREAQQLNNLSSLSEEEQKALEQLRVEIDQMTARLEEAQGMTTGEMLEELEARARAAERLARDMTAGSEEWASEAMIETMSAHADTADMAVAVRDKNAEAVAKEAFGLQEVLETESLSAEIEDRLGQTLSNIKASSEDADRARPVGERFGNASSKMERREALEAAHEFEELGKHFQFLQEREVSQDKLEDLAEAMREAGSEISGKELEKMESLASSELGERPVPQGLKGLESDDLSRGLSELQPPQESEGKGKDELPGLAGGEGEIKVPPVPGTQRDSSGADTSQQALRAPIPGEGEPNGDGGSLTANDSGEAGGGNSLQAPVPGMAPGDSNVSGQGGDEAGTGTAELVDSESTIHQARNDSKVMAQVNEEGESTFREVDGEFRQEEVTRSRRDIAAEFLAVEEQALDGKSLPLSRRKHVVRYFSAIRQQFEKEEE